MAYSSDLTDEQWALLEPVFNKPGNWGPKHAPDLRRDSVDIALHVPDGETYRRWTTSHGAGTFAKRLPDDKRDQLYRDICDRIAKHGGWTVRRSAAIWQGTKA